MEDHVPELDGLLEGRYRVVREVGRGGMATVYLAEELKHERLVALKMLRPELALSAGTDRFLREIRVTAGLRHPNIVPVLDSGRAGELPYFVMPFIEGETLGERLRRGPLPVPEAVRIAREVADALATAHAQGVVHRDIKPSNILLDAGHAVVTDFGIVHALAEAGGEELTSRGVLLGTPGYLAPEQAAGDTDLDGRCDIYALGCVLYEMLVGEPPFRAPSSLALMAKHISLPPPRVTLLRPTVPGGLDAVLQKALAKNPADRYQTSSALADALAGFEVLHADGRGAAPATGERDRRLLARPLAWTLAVVGAAAAVVAMLLARPTVELDRNRIVVFPPRNAAAGSVPDVAAADVATVVGYALEGTEPLRWIDATDRLSREDLVDPAGLSSARKRAISRELRAGYYVDGALTAGGDMVSVILRLNDVAGDSVVAQGQGAAPMASATLGRIGVDAVRELLPALVGPLPFDRLDALAQRDPAAVFHWLWGERAYRASRMEEALGHFQRALAEDSLLALAALGGARTAAWKGQYSRAGELVDAALRHESYLPPRQVELARGISAFLGGRADVGLRHAARALDDDPVWSEAWFLFSEIAYHLLPSHRLLDSVAAVGLEGITAERPRSLPTELYAWATDVLERDEVDRAHIAEEALRAALALDPGFTPPMVHLTELAIRRHALDSAQLYLDRWRDADPDPADLARVDLQLRCVRDGAESMPWREEAEADPLRVVQAAHVLLAGAAQPRCVESALRAVLETSSAPDTDRWGALLGLHALLFAQARWGELTALLDSPASSALRGEALYLLDAAAGAPVEERAREYVRRQSDDWDATPSPSLWLRLVWATRTREPSTVAAIDTVLARRRDAPGVRRDSLLADIASARVALVTGPGTLAIERLADLAPTAPPSELTWQPWESLGAERLLLAEELLTAGQSREAIATASLLDHTEPVVYLVYLPGSLDVRIRAAEAIGDAALAGLYRARMAALRPDAEGSAGRIVPPPGGGS